VRIAAVCIYLPRWSAHFSMMWRNVAVSATALAFLACGEDSAESPRPEAPGAQIWVGALDETDAKVGVVHEDGNTVLFFCGGETSYPVLTRWFSGPTALESAFSFEAAGFRVDGELVGDALEGSVLRSGEGSHAWRADPAIPGTLTGLYSGQAACGRVGLIVSQPRAEDEPTGQGACVRFIDGQITVEQVNPVLPLKQLEDFIRVTVASEPEQEVMVRPVAPASF
jgi:hypothetical protein